MFNGFFEISFNWLIWIINKPWVAVAKAEGLIYLLEGKGRMAMHDIVRMEYTKLHSRAEI